MSELIQLQSSLTRIFRETLPAPQNWGNHNAVRELRKINMELEDISPAPPNDSLTKIVAAYRRSQKPASFRDLKYVCYGAAMQTEGWCVLGDDKLRGKLLAEVEQLAEPRRRFKCFQALLNSYFTFDLYDEKTPETAHAGWEKLRDWLANQRGQFQRLGAHWKLRLPGWFDVLNNHENLLTSQPCDRYGEEMLRGNNSSIEEARQGLSIPGNSWFMQEVILSQMKVAAALGDDLFKARLEPLHNLLQGETVSKLLKCHAVAILVSRYVRCTSKPEQPTLRDAAVSVIGNPWLRKTQWDAWVKKPDGQPDDEAREMVNGWLTRQLITDFFELLSADGRADQRRLNYWLRFVPAIEGTPWLALGPDAMYNRSQPYRELRERAKGRLLHLDNPGASSNNAFIMKMGDWLIVEFGVKGNACYVYPAKPMPFSLEGVAISLHDLKDRNLGEQLRHADGHISWESNFDRATCSKVRFYPQGVISQPATKHVVDNNFAFIEQYVKKFSLHCADFRGSGGAFWVYALKGDNPEVDRNLESWKFKYKPGRGWWRE